MSGTKRRLIVRNVSQEEEHFKGSLVVLVSSTGRAWSTVISEFVVKGFYCRPSVGAITEAVDKRIQAEEYAQALGDLLDIEVAR